MSSYGQIDSDYGRRLRAAGPHGSADGPGDGPADGPIYMLTLIRFRPDAGFAGGGERARGDRAVDGRYVPLNVLSSIGATLCFVADVIASTGRFDQVTVVGYPTRRAFVTMADRPDFRQWHLAKSAAVEQTMVLGTLPAGQLPPQSGRRMLLELWDGPEPPMVASGISTGFGVEGTIVGDGRRWSGLRYTGIEAGTPLPLRPATAGYQALLLEPAIERWR